MDSTVVVRRLVQEVSPHRPSRVESSMRLVEDLGFDSVALLELLVALETEFDLPTIAPTEAKSVRTVAQLEKLVARVLGGKS